MSVGGDQFEYRDQRHRSPGCLPGSDIARGAAGEHDQFTTGEHLDLHQLMRMLLALTAGRWAAAVPRRFAQPHFGPAPSSDVIETTLMINADNGAPCNR